MNCARTALSIGVPLLLILAACGPAGPAIGLGPAIDPIIGTILLIAIIVGGLWAVKSVARSPVGRAIERQVSKTGQSLRNEFNRIVPARAAGIVMFLRRKRSFGSDIHGEK
jgi:hypothetical protein